MTQTQLDQAVALTLKERRQGYSIGKLYTMTDVTEVESLVATIEQVFSIFGVEMSTLSCTMVPSPSFQIYNRTLLGQMKQLARNKDHQLRLQMYTTLIDATLIALVNDDGSLKKCDTIVNFDCFGAFTDEKHALQYDPRGNTSRNVNVTF